jgi:hypothetical protein
MAINKGKFKAPRDGNNQGNFKLHGMAITKAKSKHIGMKLTEEKYYLELRDYI